MVLNNTFSNISVISWWSVLLVEETTDLPQVTDKLYHIMLSNENWGRLGPDRMIVGFTITCVIIAYHH
jgi:hypothetical protein